MKIPLSASPRPRVSFKSEGSPDEKILPPCMKIPLSASPCPRVYFQIRREEIDR
ncbi:MAG: hypothetical protein F6K41_26430 [Symploca sp. SIO3E6]|nr:hypothetical protein [Caldora sp. SIO3E6]